MRCWIALIAMQSYAAVEVPVFLKVDPAVPAMEVFVAKRLATRLMATADVTLIWESSPLGHGDGERPIIIQLVTQSRADFHPGALAFAQPYEQRSSIIVVFHDRVRFGSEETPALTAVLLGHVFAHELTHVLQGIGRHSETGIMKANWTTRDVSAMRTKPLEFTSEDVSLIQDGIVWRHSHLSAKR